MRAAGGTSNAIALFAHSIIADHYQQKWYVNGRNWNGQHNLMGIKHAMIVLQKHIIKLIHFILFLYI